MRVLIVGAGIGGLTAALALHGAGIDVEIFEQSAELGELGVGLNVLPHATRELASLGLLPELEREAVLTRELIYATRRGQIVWREPRGRDAGHDAPQLSVHRGRLHRVLTRAVYERIGEAHVHAGCVLAAFASGDDEVMASFEGRLGGRSRSVVGDALVGCDGIHSTTRQLLYPHEGPPRWSGIWLWRGATELPRFADGHTMVIAGGNDAKLVIYPVAPGSTPDRQLTNWGVMARVGRPGDRPPRREDWSRPAQRDEVHEFVAGRFRLDLVDPSALVTATPAIYEYPNCDRDPLPRWSFDRVTLLGDAAHPMYPVGSNGASQAILDARAVARHLTGATSVVEAFRAYDDERRPATTEIVLRNRRGGPEQVIDLVESRAPGGFDDVDAVVSFAEREAIVRGYAGVAGFAAPSAPGHPDR